MKLISILAVVVVLLISISSAAGAQDGCIGNVCMGYICKDENLTIGLGDFIPFITGYGNGTDSQVTFTVKMSSNMFFGPEHVAWTEILPAHIGEWLSTPDGFNTTTICRLEQTMLSSKLLQALLAIRRLHNAVIN